MRPGKALVAEQIDPEKLGSHSRAKESTTTQWLQPSKFDFSNKGLIGSVCSVLRETEQLGSFLRTNDLATGRLPIGRPVEQLRRLDLLGLRLEFGHGVLW